MIEFPNYSYIDTKTIVSHTYHFKLCFYNLKTAWKNCKKLCILLEFILKLLSSLYFQHVKILF